MYLSIEYKFLFIHIPKCAGEWLYNKLRYGIHASRIAYWGLDKGSDIDLAHLYQDIVNIEKPSKQPISNVVIQVTLRIPTR